MDECDHGGSHLPLLAVVNCRRAIVYPVKFFRRTISPLARLNCCCTGLGHAFIIFTHALEQLDMTKRPSPESPAGSKRRPCDACRTAKVKCNYEEPCENCAQKGRGVSFLLIVLGVIRAWTLMRQCVYSMDESGRLRKFHKRSKLGCTRCKTRRVRCDEIKPVCGGCSRTGAAAQVRLSLPPEMSRDSSLVSIS